MKQRTTQAGVGVLFAVMLVLPIFPDLGQAQGAAPEELEVVPGVGVLRQMEIGMTLSEIKARRKDAVISELAKQPGSQPAKPYYASIPRLGAYFGTSGTNTPVALLNFDVDARKSSNVFSGTVAGGLRFGNGKSVTRADVVRVFGPIPSFDKAGVSNARILLEKGQDVALTDDSGAEMLYYTSRGIMFDVRDGVVVRFSVMKAGLTDVER